MSDWTNRMIKDGPTSTDHAAERGPERRLRRKEVLHTEV